jgi:hypothetical protein
MESSADHASSFSDSIAERLKDIASGEPVLRLINGAEQRVYEPIHIGSDYIECMSGSGGSYRVVVIPFRSILSILL